MKFKRSIIAHPIDLFEQLKIAFYESKTIIWMMGNVVANTSYVIGSVIICDPLPYRRAVDVIIKVQRLMKMFSSLRALLQLLKILFSLLSVLKAKINFITFQ